MDSMLQIGTHNTDVKTPYGNFYPINVRKISCSEYNRLMTIPLEQRSDDDVTAMLYHSETCSHHNEWIQRDSMWCITVH